jgi:hypothetical protein
MDVVSSVGRLWLGACIFIKYDQAWRWSTCACRNWSVLCTRRSEKLVAWKREASFDKLRGRLIEHRSIDRFTGATCLHGDYEYIHMYIKNKGRACHDLSSTRHTCRIFEDIRGGKGYNKLGSE